MCCRLSVFPLVPEVARDILLIGLFKPVYWHPLHPDVAINYERAVPEESCVVNANITGDSLELNISPAISAYAHHAGKRVTASIYFEIAAKYAEKVGGEIIQRANVVGCKQGDDLSGLVLARYPSQPMMWEKICSGFRAVLLGTGDDI